MLLFLQNYFVGPIQLLQIINLLPHLTPKSVPKEPNAANPSNNPKSSEKEVVANYELPTLPKVGTEAVGGSAKPPMQHKGLVRLLERV
jgi:hypothetical protein